MNRLTHRHIEYIPLYLSVILFLVFRHFFYQQTGDDSYIYFRYIERAVAGHWWSWTNQLPAVEGYSSPLWYLLLVVLGKLGFVVIDAARFLGALFLAYTLFATWHLAKALQVSTLLASMVCLLLVLNHGVNYWASAGLETALYTALVVSVALTLVNEKYWLLPLALLGLARPEGMFLLLGILAGMWVFKRHLLSVNRVLLVLAPSVIWLLLRGFIYHQPLPNTFYAKATGDIVQQIELGALYAIPVLLPLLLLWYFCLEKRTNNIVVVLGIITMLLAIIIIGGGDWMFHFRLLVPLYGLLLAVCAYFWLSIGRWKKVVLLLCMLPYMLSVVPYYYYEDAFLLKKLPVKDFQEGELTVESITLAKELQRYYPAAKLIAVNHAGALPWAMPQYNFIDMVGLSDPHIAHVKGNLHHKYDEAYVLEQKPDLLILNSRIKPGEGEVWYHPGYWAGEDALVRHNDFNYYRPTAFVKEWHWRVPFPFSLVQNADRSWVIVYERIKSDVLDESKAKHDAQ